MTADTSSTHRSFVPASLLMSCVLQLPVWVKHSSDELLRVLFFFIWILKKRFGFLDIFKEQRAHGSVRDCVPPSLCAAQNQTLSYSDADFTVAASVRCCKTDGCNSQDVPRKLTWSQVRKSSVLEQRFSSHRSSVSDPDPGQKNGRRCPTSSGRPDNTFTVSVVECVGVQDRCIDAVCKSSCWLLVISHFLKLIKTWLITEILIIHSGKSGQCPSTSGLRICQCLWTSVSAESQIWCHCYVWCQHHTKSSWRQLL